jgi:hypothetical protein
LIRRVTASDALVIVESHQSSESEWVKTEVTVAGHHFRRYVLVVAETTGRPSSPIVRDAGMTSCTTATPKKRHVRYSRSCVTIGDGEPRNGFAG